MIQLNLLPDIKMEYLKAERNWRLVLSISIIVSAAAIVLAVSMFSITALQKKQIDSVSNDIKRQGSLISGQSNLNDILTVQNQINTLTSLHQAEPEASNLETYLYQTVPTSVGLSDLSIDFNADSIEVDGTADSLSTIDQFVDSLKFATYTVSGQSGSNPAFSNVVLTSFGVDSSGTSFTINLSFDPTIFNNTENVTLTVPSKVTTRSELSQPTNLFDKTSTSNG